MGVEKQVLTAGTGPKPVSGQSVTVHCTGFGKGGDLSQKFWSTKDPGQQPFTFKIGQGTVIKGWDEGVMGMQVGEVARLTRFRLFSCYCDAFSFRMGTNKHPLNCYQCFGKALLSGLCLW